MITMLMPSRVDKMATGVEKYRDRMVTSHNRIIRFGNAFCERMDIVLIEDVAP
jgi:hypothetical protein